MANKVLIRSGIADATAAGRRMLPGVTAATAAPTVKGDGVLLQRNEYIHLFFKLTETDPASYFTLQLWWYSPISATWHKGESFTVNDDDVYTFEVQGFDRAYLQVTTVGYDSSSYAAPTLEAWIGLVVPV